MHFAKTMLPNSVGMRVALAYMAGMVLSIALLVLAAAFVLQEDVLARMDLQGAAEDMVGLIRFDEQGHPVALDSDEDDLAWVFESLRREAAYRILDQQGVVILTSNADEAFWPTDEQAALPDKSFEFEQDGVVIYGVTARFEKNGEIWYLQVASSTRLMMLLHRVALPLVGMGIMAFSLVSLLAFILFAYITLRYTLKPLRDVSESAIAISPRSLHARLEAQSVPSEIVSLVESFNRVLDRVEQGYRIQQEFLGNVAHELKTPLSLIRAQIELGEGDRKAQQALLQDVEYMSRQVQQLLLLAEASEPQNYRFAQVAVQDVAEEAVAYLQRMAARADVYLTVSAETAGLMWEADRGALFTLLKNLLENAIQHAPAGTAVSLEIRHEGLTVRDRGMGVADHTQLPLLFERFWRATNRRDFGAGLGLAICQEIAITHGWTLTAEQAAPGLIFCLLRITE